jgi:hypothetical protein
MTFRDKENPLFKPLKCIEQEQGIAFVSPGLMAQEVANNCKEGLNIRSILGSVKGVNGYVCSYL